MGGAGNNHSVLGNPIPEWCAFSHLLMLHFNLHFCVIHLESQMLRTSEGSQIEAFKEEETDTVI